MIDDRNYRLAHCVGYAAFDPGGRIGVVAELEFRSREDRPDALVVRRGLLRRRTKQIPVEQVVQIDPDARRVVVHGAPVGRVRWRESMQELETTAADLPLATSGGTDSRGGAGR